MSPVTRRSFASARRMGGSSRVLAGSAAGLVLSLGLLAPAARAAASRADASVQLAGPAATEALEFSLSDPSNRTWTLESSPDLRAWTPVQEFTVHNSVFTVAVPRLAGSSRTFLRAVTDDAAPLPTQTLADALALPSPAYDYVTLDLPAHLRTPVIRGQDNTPAGNPVTDASAALGRVLFHDRRLSANHTVSCASCHQQEHGFSDPRPLSIGFDGGATGRNSMGLASARYYPRGHFFWDERAATLEDQVLQPIQNEVEMGLTLDELVARVSAEDYYRDLFTAAFGDATVTSNRIARALAQFVRSIVSSRTRYDEGVATGFANFTDQELLGLQVFRGDVGRATCTACHGTDNFVPANIFNNGLENPIVDQGVGGVTGNAADVGKFKVPSLRNIALTAPYMHDGRFATLEDVVEFYDHGVVLTPTLGPALVNPPGAPGAGQPRRLNLTTAQKAALVAFLRTLTDESLAADPRFSDPFRYE